MKNFNSLVFIAIFSITFSVFADKTLIVKNYFCPAEEEVMAQIKMNATQFTDSLSLTYQIFCTTKTIPTLVWTETKIDNLQSRVECAYQIPNEIDFCRLTATGSVKPLFPTLWSLNGKCEVEKRMLCIFRGEFI